MFSVYRDRDKAKEKNNETNNTLKLFMLPANTFILTGQLLDIRHLQNTKIL